MPNRRRYRGPRPAAEGAAPDSAGAPPPRPAANLEGSGGEGSRPAGRRRRRGRGGRGASAGQASTAGATGPLEAEGERASAGGWDQRQPHAGEPAEGDAGPRRRRRRRGRGRGGEAQPAGADIETPEGELPADYIALPVERGTAFLFEPRETSLEVVDEEPEPAKPARSKRINSGKLFWYIRSKSYVPIPELRRRFEITPDEMGTIQDNGHKVYIGLPQDVADVVGNLRRQQKIGLECSVDFSTPVVVGVYPLNR